jgi:tetratricopeptide (TPR) repeat protein
MRRTAMLAVWGGALLALMASASPDAWGDTVHLKDGSKIEGEVIEKTGAGWVIKGADGKTVSVATDQVKSFEAKRGATADEPIKRLESLRRSVDGATDIPKILERYRKFIEQYVGTAAETEALKDVHIWEQRLSQSMVKVGSAWLTPMEQQERRRKGAEQAEAARQMLIAGRLRDATKAIDSAISEDPQNAAAHYLRGVVSYRQEQLVNARKAFDVVAQLEPAHAPTHNNLAVIMWANKQYAGAINSYGQAMNLAVGTRSILDNVAEALNELPESQRDNAATKKVVLLFNAQDMLLQKRMKTRGLYRWGSTWVDEKTLKDLQVEQDRIDESIERMEEEYEQVQDRIEEIDRDMGDTQRSIRRIEASSYGRDASGRAVRLSYPRLYYDLKRDLEQLHDERDGEAEKTGRLRKKAKEIRQSISVPRYAGVQQIIGVEGAPGLEPLANANQKAGEEDVAPTTAPTTRAAGQ